MSRRWRPIAIWTGAALSTLIAAAWVASRWHYILWTWTDANGGLFSSSIQSGQIGCTRIAGPMQLEGYVEPWPGGLHHSVPSSAGPGPHWSHIPRCNFGRDWRLILPLWLPFLLIAAPTAWLWHRTRRVPPGHCPKCRYDLTGIATSTCPECGSPTRSETAT
jgi:hypothetical protein